MARDAAHVCRVAESDWTMVALHNFGGESCIVPVELADEGGCILVDILVILVDLLHGLTEHELDSTGRIDIGLEPYGCRWLRLRRPDDDPIIWQLTARTISTSRSSS